ncbi:MAG: hypothetical protein Q4C20_01000 [Erysipelotrichaceae bacterium]|nr:hypothetical protein [Erysipelotrichaceae bacterium]
MLRDIIDFEKLLVIGTALRRFDLRFLEDCKIKNPELKIYCLLLNSVSSITFSNYTIKSKFNSFPWDSVLTFDPIDARENNWRYIGLNYYSKHQMLGIEKIENDIFFAGSIVGSRGDKIIEILKYLSENSISCEFMCPRVNKSQRSQDFPDGINLLRKRVSYSEILQKMLKSNCILEILQPGQGGGTLRYFEAVCYNKKLLTTNQRIKEYLFYNEKYMKIFSDFSDIDLNWIRKVEPIDYGYVDEFSPKYLKLDE